MNLKKGNLNNILLILILTSFSLIILCADKCLIPQYIQNMYNFPGGDKVGHVVLLLLFSLITNLIFYTRKIKIKNNFIFMGSIIIFCLITIEEFSQIFIPSRSFDLLDLLCNYLGIILGDIMLRIIYRNR